MYNCKLSVILQIRVQILPQLFTILFFKLWFEYFKSNNNKKYNSYYYEERQYSMIKICLKKYSQPQLYNHN